MNNKDRKKFNQLKVEFLPEALEIIEKPASPLGHCVVWIVFILLLIFILWACFGKIDEVAVARGQVMSDDGAQEIQSASNGIVAEVMVKEGDVVKKGDILFCLDKEVEKANIEYSEGEIGLMELKAELLSQLLDGKDITVYRNGEYNAEELEVIESMISYSESNEISLEEYEIAVENAKNQYELAKKELENNKDKEEYLEEQQELQEKSQELESTESIELQLLESEYEYAVDEEAKYKKLYEAGAKSKTEWEAKLQEVESLKKQIEIKKVEIKNEKLSEQGDKSTMEYQISENKADYTNRQGTVEEMKNNYDAAVLNLENAKKKRESTLYEKREECVARLKEYGVSVTQQYYEYEKKIFTHHMMV